MRNVGLVFCLFTQIAFSLIYNVCLFFKTTNRLGTRMSCVKRQLSISMSIMIVSNTFVSCVKCQISVSLCVSTLNFLINVAKSHFYQQKNLVTAV